MSARQRATADWEGLEGMAQACLGLQSAANYDVSVQAQDSMDVNTALDTVNRRITRTLETHLIEKQYFHTFLVKFKCAIRKCKKYCPDPYSFTHLWKLQGKLSTTFQLPYGPIWIKFCTASDTKTTFFCCLFLMLKTWIPLESQACLNQFMKSLMLTPISQILFRKLILSEKCLKF